jgi:FkbH-like protein
MDTPRPELHLVSDFNLADLANILKNRPGNPWQVRLAPLDSVVPVLSGSGKSDASALVWTRPDRICAAFQETLHFAPADTATALAEVDRYADLLIDAARHWKALYVPLWWIPLEDRHGTRELTTGAHGLLLRMNAHLVERLGESPGIHVLNTGRWTQRAGATAWSTKLWYLSKSPFAREVLHAAADDLLHHHELSTGGAIKLIVLDLDDTLWGGIVGDDGWENLRLGGHDAIGESFKDFQRSLKSLKERGIMLAIASKNEASTALEAIDKHPEMVLRRDDFVAMRIDWNDKPGNIADIIRALNIGARSVLFIDDNPVERARVREFLPEVMVPEWPENKLLYDQALRRLPAFDLETLSAEDLRRTQLYREEADRERSRTAFEGVDAWLTSLGTTVQVARLNEADFSRVHQLFGKTNQFNLTTRRWTEKELRERMSDERRPIWSFRVSDRFGDAGLTGILGLDLHDPEEALITDLVMSCRVLGRRVEETLLHLAVAKAAEAGKATVRAVLLPTAKNKPCLDFLVASGLQRHGEYVFVRETANPYPCPSTLRLVLEEQPVRS